MGSATVADFIVAGVAWFEGHDLCLLAHCQYHRIMREAGRQFTERQARRFYDADDAVIDLGRGLLRMSSAIHHDHHMMTIN